MIEYMYYKIYMSKLTKEQLDYLNDLYYKQHYYFGRDKIYERIKRDDENITKVKLMDWLKDQHLHQLYTPTYKTKNIKTTILTKPNQQIDIDLIDMMKYEYDNYKYIFTAIDLFSKRSYAYPLFNKNDSYKALRKLIRDPKGQISSIRSDRGSEFIDNKFKSILDDILIEQYDSEVEEIKQEISKQKNLKKLKQFPKRQPKYLRAMILVILN